MKAFLIAYEPIGTKAKSISFSLRVSQKVLRVRIGALLLLQLNTKNPIVVTFTGSDQRKLNTFIVIDSSISNRKRGNYKPILLIVVNLIKIKLYKRGFDYFTLKI